MTTTSAHNRVIVTIRVMGEERPVPLKQFHEHYDRCRPDGSLM